MEQDHLTTHIVAVGGIMSPFWLHYLSDTSQQLLPILGAGWIAMKMIGYVYTTWIKPKKEADVSKD
jgi:hypothetical protein